MTLKPRFYHFGVMWFWLNIRNAFFMCFYQASGYIGLSKGTLIGLLKEVYACG